jgi:hypothetical protein
LRGSAIYLTIIDSSFETLATLLLIAVCMGNSYVGYCEVRDLIIYDQWGNRRDNPHVRVMRQWMMKFVIAGLLLMGCSLGFFLVCLVTYRLWWTILSNNVCIMIVQVFAAFIDTGRRWLPRGFTRTS